MGTLVQLFGVVWVVSGFGLLGFLIAGAPASVFGFGLFFFVIGLVGWLVAGAIDR